MEASFIFFSDFMLISKKKVLCLSSASFLRASCDIQEQGAVNCSCLRFWAENKHASFWWEKKCRNSQNFSAKMPEKMSRLLLFFALIRNTASQLDVIALQCWFEKSHTQTTVQMQSKQSSERVAVF